MGFTMVNIFIYVYYDRVTHIVFLGEFLSNLF